MTGKFLNVLIVTSSAIDKMFEMFGPIFEQNAVNFGPIFEQNANFGPIFVSVNLEHFVNGR